MLGQSINSPIVVQKKIGSGTFGSVYLLADGYAGKRFKVDISHDERGLPRDGVREISFLTGLTSEFVVPIVNVLIADDYLWCVMPRAEVGTLRNLMKNYALNSSLGRCLIGQLFAALTFVHSRNVIHRDLKPENILVFNDKDTQYRIKLCDFGSALNYCVPQSPYIVPDARTDPITSLWYRSPENALELGIHAYSMDIWAAGLIVCEIVTGFCPTFTGAKSNTDLLSRMCSMLGIPTIENDIMPSYTSKHERFPMVYRVCATLPYEEYTFPPWAESIVKGALCMEPTRRPPAAWCAGHLGEFIDICPKTPKVCDNGSRSTAPCPSMNGGWDRETRIAAGIIIFETCFYRHIYQSRRAFHTAIKLIDRIYHKFDITKQSIPRYCAGVVSIASKICDSHGVGPNWGSIVRKYACQKPSPANFVGLARYDLDTYDIVALEQQILQEVNWDPWDVTILDIPIPEDIAISTYNYVVDMMVSMIDTANCSIYDISQVAAYVARAIHGPGGYNRLLSIGMWDLLNEAVKVINSNPAISEHIRDTHRRWCGRDVYAKVNIDFEKINWV